MVIAKTEPCSLCEGRGWVLLEDGPGAGAAAPCSCRATRTLELRRQRSAVPPRYLGSTLSNFDVVGSDQLLQAREMCRRYVDRFVTADGEFRSTGLLLVGPPGTGKTHLAVAMLKELIERYSIRGLFVDFTSLVHEIQSTFDPQSSESKRQVLDPVINAEVLVLDELGAQRPTPFVNDTLYLVLNARYTRCLPTIFTTNYPLAEASASQDLDRRQSSASHEALAARIPARLVSRLYEMAKVVELEVSDFRRGVKSAQTEL